MVTSIEREGKRPGGQPMGEAIQPLDGTPGFRVPSLYRGERRSDATPADKRVSLDPSVRLRETNKRPFASQSLPKLSQRGRRSRTNQLPVGPAKAETLLGGRRGNSRRSGGTDGLPVLDLKLVGDTRAWGVSPCCTFSHSKILRHVVARSNVLSLHTLHTQATAVPQVVQQ